MTMEPMGTLVAGIAVLNAFGLFVTASAGRMIRQTSDTPRCRKEPRAVYLARGAETLRFLRAWLRAPLQVAAVAPSGPALARLMTAEISGVTGPVIELGPGTGPFTRALIARGVREEELTLIEFGEPFADALRRDFPAARTIRMDAAAIGKVELLAGRPAGAVVSGLPLLSMTRRQVTAIMKGAFEKLTPDGAFYQFTYGPRCPVPAPMLKRLGLEAERLGGTFANLPPATVYRIRRASRHAVYSSPPDRRS